MKLRTMVMLTTMMLEEFGRTDMALLVPAAGAGYFFYASPPKPRG